MQQGLKSRAPSLSGLTGFFMIDKKKDLMMEEGYLADDFPPLPHA